MQLKRWGFRRCHPLPENVTAISGTFKVGIGDTFAESKMGSFPCVQIHGTAPVQFNHINPSRRSEPQTLIALEKRDQGG